MNYSDYALEMANSQDTMSSDLADTAINLFRKNGFIRLNNVFDPHLMEKFIQDYNNRYLLSLKKAKNDDKRPLHTVTMKASFNTPEYYANEKIVPILSELLGPDFIIGSVSGVLSFPGAPDQRLHRDSEPLYNNDDDYTVDAALPTHSVTMLIPLVDCNEKTGCTRVWPGSHLCSSLEETEAITPIDPEVNVGSVLLTDSRILHHGAKNQSSMHRPLLYITYHRHWFRDYWGYEQRPPIDISRSQLNKVPKQYRHMFAWTKNPYRKWKIKQIILNFLPNALLNRLNILRGN